MTAVSPVKDNRRESAGPGTKSNTENSRRKNEARNVTIIIKNYFFKESVSDSVGSIFHSHKARIIFRNVHTYLKKITFLHVIY